ncbi:forkhead box protein N3-like isoform X2 [Homalodisca vitripennis]|uniref:forkhead box protein N3-like isoform X2 n=1 Tax=Homalodisca vitripennis TaxID=197043 RepID=UPI001EEAA6C1|nr:forkhead box protein N3-like isoform X2 [Homalodisca vitripennis]
MFQVLSMAPERPGPEDEPGVALSANNSLAIPVTLLSIPNTLLHIKEGDGASEERSEKSGEDDDLTSLTWLQDKNLLKGINLRTNGTGVQESPTSDYVDDSASERDSTCSSINSASPTPPPTTVPAIKNKHPHHIPYDPQIHTTSKPPYSFSCLIFMAIEEAPGKALPVKEIYGWILEHFPFYKNAPTGWKNSVRHNLSLNKCFRKVDKAPAKRVQSNFLHKNSTIMLQNLGKGSLWMVDPLYRSNLLQALQKAPYHPCTSLDKANRTPPTPTSPVHKPAVPKVNGSSRLPDPELFPYLARRLAAVEGSDPLDDVDAAAAMLELKHGPNARANISMRRDEYHRRLGAHLVQNTRGAKRKIKIEAGDAMLITSSPSEDHTYSSAEPSSTTTVKSEPASPDEAFAEGSDSDSSWNLPVKLEVDCTDIEEQRKIAEGADALLNLAGITTQQTPPPTPLKKQNAPFRPRLLRKTPPAKHRRNESDISGLKNRWKPGIITENNNVIEQDRKRDEYQPPTKIRRKSSSGSGKSLGKFKR